MNFYRKRRWRVLRDYCIGWILAMIFLSVVRGVGTEELGSLQFGFLQSLQISFTLGPIIGVVSGLASILLEEKFYKHISILRLLILRLLYGILFIILLVVLAYGVYQLYFGTDIDIITFAFDDGSGAIYFYILFVDSALNVLRQINMMLGEGNLMKFLQGKFYHPREEERIFMFLDLQSSTRLAEKLGNLKYSSLIQDCFNDLGVVVEHDAEIYQYVGDEAVLTWKLKEGIKNQNCIRAFFRFKMEIENRKNYYEEKYGETPFFKAGVHLGKITVTEIGKFKKEIAYHGDPVNTAARIQSQCNAFGEELLTSRDLVEVLGNKSFNFKELGLVPLKGKQKEVAILAVEVESQSLY